MVIRDSLYELGIELRRTMFGPGGSDDQVDNTTDVDDKLQDFVTRYCFGDIWQREALSIPDRSKITLAMLIAQGKPHEIRVHLRGAIENGVSVAELREIAIHSLLYCGIPAAVEAVRALNEVLDEKGLSDEIDGESETAK